MRYIRQILNEALADLGINPAEKDHSRTQVVEGWDEQCHETGQTGVPLLVRRDGGLLAELARDADLSMFLEGGLWERHEQTSARILP